LIDEATIPAGWRELNRSYEERFGIAAEEATRPPLERRARLIQDHRRYTRDG
jgi:hypothetical protein